MSKMVPITSPDLILSSFMEPGHREPLDQLFKRWLDLLQYPLTLFPPRDTASEPSMAVGTLERPLGLGAPPTPEPARLPPMASWDPLSVKNNFH